MQAEDEKHGRKEGRRVGGVRKSPFPDLNVDGRRKEGRKEGRLGEIALCGGDGGGGDGKRDKDHLIATFS